MSKQTRGLGYVFRPTYTDRRSRERKEGAVWWVQYYYQGKRYRESSGSTRRADAVKLLRRRLAEIGQGRLVGPDAERVTFENLKTLILDDYRVNARRSLERLGTALKHLGRFFESYKALHITTDRVNAYIRERQEEGAAPASIQKELAALKRAFNLAVEAGLLTARPHIPSVKVRNIRTGFFEEAEFRALLAELPEHLRPVMEFACLTGWRIPSEVLPLTWRQVDFEAGIVRLEPGTTKNDEGRTFPFDVYPQLEALLRRQREGTVALERVRTAIIPWLFHRNGERIRDFRGAWASACKRAATKRAGDKVMIVRPELLNRVPHDLRRTAVRNLERAGVPRSVAMKLTGHKTESVYRRYAIVAESDLREGVAKLAALHGREQSTQSPGRAFRSASAKVQPKSGQVAGRELVSGAHA